MESQLSSIVTSVKIEKIGENAFKKCLALKEVNLGESKKYHTIQMSTFEESLISENTLPDSIIYLQERCFYGFSHLNTIKFSPNLEKIGKSAFEASALTAVELIGTQYSKISTKAFYSCTDLTLVTFSDTINIVESGAFALTQVSIVLMTSCSEIGAETFHLCSELSNVDLERTSISVLPTDIFKECISLSMVILPENLLRIEQNAFVNCKSLSELNLPQSLESIDKYGFKSCGSLQTLDFSETQITNFSEFCFYECANLDGIIFPNHNKKIYIEERSFAFSGLIKIKIPSNCDHMGYHCFEGCSKLTSVDMSECKVSSFVGSLMENCPNLVEIILPSTLNNLWSKCLSSTGIRSFECSTLLTLASNVFQHCKKLMKVDFSGSTFTYVGAYCFFECSELQEVILPDTVNYIMAHSFDGCTNLTTINTPLNLTRVAEFAFSKCASLEYADFSKSKLEVVDGYCFAECTSLKEIIWSPNIKTVRFYQTTGCVNMQKVTLTATMENLESFTFADCGVLEVDMSEFHGALSRSMFSKCRKLKTVRWPKRPFSIGEKSFTMYDSLDPCVLPATLTSIAPHAFRGSRNMATVDFGRTSITEIPNEVFAGNTGTTTIVFPPNVTSIGTAVFFWCPLKDVYYAGTNDLSKIPNPFVDATIESMKIHVTNGYPGDKFAGFEIVRDILDPVPPSEDTPSPSLEEETESPPKSELESESESEDTSSIISISDSESSSNEELEISSSNSFDPPHIDGDDDNLEEEQDDGDEFGIWSIVGGSIGGTILFVCIIVVACVLSKRRNRKMDDDVPLVMGLTDPASWIFSDTQINIYEPSVRTMWNDYIIEDDFALLDHTEL